MIKEKSKKEKNSAKKNKKDFKAVDWVRSVRKKFDDKHNNLSPDEYFKELKKTANRAKKLFSDRLSGLK